MSAPQKLRPIVGDRHGDGRDDGYWSGSGRYERGDRRDRRLTHWTYGARVDAARIRRLIAMLHVGWPQIDDDGRKGKRFRTSAKILTKIALSYNVAKRVSYITKASIAADLGMHRNTIYKHCKAMELAGVLLQGHYSASKGSDYKTYSVFAIPGMSGRLPVILSFRRRHARKARVVSISWPMATIARYGQQPLPQSNWPILVTPANEDLFKNVHRTCDQDLYLQQAVQNAAKASRSRLKEGSRTEPSVRQVDNGAANRGRSLREVPRSALKRLICANKEGFEGKASQFLPSPFEGSLSGVERVRSVMQAYERAFGHLENYQPIVGFPRGWMRARVLAITPDEWARLVRLVLDRPMLCGAAPMNDGRMFELNFWWLMKEAPRLLAQLAPVKLAPATGDRVTREAQRPITPTERDQMIAEIRAKNPELAKTLASWAADLNTERPDDVIAPKNTPPKKERPK